MKKVIVFVLMLMIGALFLGCSDASVVSANISKSADQFEIFRRVVFYNGITDQYILMVEGYCSINIDTADKQLELTVKTGPGTYLKHYLGLSDNVTYFAEQIEPARVSSGQYRVIFKPSALLPTLEIK